MLHASGCITRTENELRYLVPFISGHSIGHVVIQCNTMVAISRTCLWSLHALHAIVDSFLWVVANRQRLAYNPIYTSSHSNGCLLHLLWFNNRIFKSANRKATVTYLISIGKISSATVYYCWDYLLFLFWHIGFTNS